MVKLQEKKQINNLAILFAITYMISYITRINYGAVISEMVIETGISKSLLSLSLTGSFITYGAGQIISGICGDKFSPKKLVSCGLLVTVFMNILIPLCSSPYQMLIVWCINGFAQAFLWPPLVQLMTTLLTEADYAKVAVKVSWGSSLGTIVVYLAAPLLISFFSWKSVFFFSAGLGLVMLLVWNKYSYEIKPQKKVEKEESTNGSIKIFFTPLMIGVMIAIILQGMLRDGVTTWMPSYITETYNMSNIISILTGVVLPIFGIISFQVSSVLYRMKFKNPLMCSGVIFGVGALSALALYFLSGSSASLSVLFSALLTASMHGVNLILICMIPPFFKKYGNVSTASGILNSCTYIGSAISTYGIAVLSESRGWSFTLLIWLMIALAGTAICLICVKPWAKKFSDTKNITD